MASASIMEPKRTESGWRGFGWWLPALASLGAGAASLVGGVGGGGWLVDLCTPFQAQYAGVQVLCLLAFALLRRRAWVLVAAVLLMVPGQRLVPYFRSPAEPQTGTRSLRVMSFNLLSANQRRAEVLRWVKETDPDVAFFPEVTPAWAEALEELRATMPHGVVMPREGNFGFALFSKHPLREESLRPSGLLEAAALRVGLDLGGSEVVVIGAHPLPPLSGAMARDRDEVLARLAAEVRETQAPVVMVGDLNATPWCHGMKPVYAAGLRDTRWGRGLATTWRSNNPLVAIPIDHVLIKGALAVANHRIGPDLGSDHRAVVVDLRL